MRSVSEREDSDRSAIASRAVAGRVREVFTARWRSWRRVTGSYTAFIHWPFQRENTPLGRARSGTRTSTARSTTATNEDILRGRVVRMAGADEYLRMLAIARLYFDNIAIAAEQLGDDGAEGRSARAVLRRQRHGQRDDGGERRQRRRHDLPPGRARDLPADPRCRLGAGPAGPVLQRPAPPRRPGRARPAPAENPPVRNVRKIDKQFIGTAPGLDDGADRSVRVQLPLLGEGR